MSDSVINISLYEYESHVSLSTINYNTNNCYQLEKCPRKLTSVSLVCLSLFEVIMENYTEYELAQMKGANVICLPQQSGR